MHVCGEVFINQESTYIIIHSELATQQGLANVWCRLNAGLVPPDPASK